MRGIMWSLWNGRVRPWLDRLPPHIPVATDLDWLTLRWGARFPEGPPIGDTIRRSKQWVRFHSLPESKRYAESEVDYAELLRRHHAVLDTLAEPASELLAITASWSVAKHVPRRAKALEAAAPHAKLWMSIVEEPDDNFPRFTHLFVSEIKNSPRSLDALLRLVADDETGDVILMNHRLDWLYHPYDGGADVVAPSRDSRDVLMRRFADWLPNDPAGL